jgi:hypothetical protein
MSHTPLFDAALDKILAPLTPHTRTCVETGEEFEITEKDIEMCKSLRVPPPKTNWIVRMRQKRSFMGGYDLYRRTLPDGQSVVTMYDPESFTKILPAKDWYSDAFDPMAYGQDADPNRSFFDQWEQLSRTIPRPSMQQDASSENSEWSIYIFHEKNAYNCWGAVDGEDITYVDMSGWTKYSSDLTICMNCEWCYDDVSCNFCSYTHFSERCENSNHLLFCLACKNCSDCFGCTNLRNKKYCFLDEQLTEEEYKKRLASIDLADSHAVEDWVSKIKIRWEKAYRRGASIQNSENAAGDDILNSKDVMGIFVWDSERVWRGVNVVKAIDSYDTIGGHGLERCCNDVMGMNGFENRMTNMCLSCIDVEYSELCTSCEYCFGCIGLQHKKYCIFNKQYTEEEYWPLIDAIKTAMLERGEYGDFFPHRLNAIAYNSSNAMALFPMTETEATTCGMRWYSFADEQKGEAEPASAIPEKLADTKEAILKQAFRCPITNRIFRFVKPELEFHREMNLALPRIHPSVRRFERALRLPSYFLHERTCASCGATILTRIRPTHTAPVLCQDCYEKVVIGEKEAPKT